MQNSILILSGGLDSTVAAYLSRNDARAILALTFDYGQRAAANEIRAAQTIAGHLDVPHRSLSFSWLKEITRTSLVDASHQLPHPSLKDLDDNKASLKSARDVWVPNRNGLFVNAAACFAESLGAKLLITGFNREEAATFPDNSVPFVAAANQLFSYSTSSKVIVDSPTLGLTKIDIARKALALGVPIANLWFCYEGGTSPCRQCESCQRNFRAFHAVGIPDTWKTERSACEN